MKTVAILSIIPGRQKRNNAIRKALVSAGIEFTEIGSKYRKVVQVSNDKELEANAVILAIKLY